MTIEEFKRRWESDENGGGITNDDIAKCAVEWGLCRAPRTRPIPAIIAMVTMAANTNDWEYWASRVSERTDVPDCDEDRGSDMIVVRDPEFGGDDMASSLAQTRANDRYKRKTYDDIKLRVPKGYRDSVLRAAADAEGMSINEYVLSTVADRILQDHPEIDGADEWKVSLLKSKPDGGQ